MNMEPGSKKSNLFISQLRGTRLPGTRFQGLTCQGAKSPTLSSARDCSCLTGARPTEASLRSIADL